MYVRLLLLGGPFMGTRGPNCVREAQLRGRVYERERGRTKDGTLSSLHGVFLLALQ